MVALALAAAILACLIWPVRGARRRGSLPVRDTAPYWRRMYGRRSFLRLGGSLVAAAALAYSGADEAVDAWHARAVRGQTSDALARLAKPQGERFWFLVWLATALLDATWRSSSFSRWGRANFEAMLVGLPTLWTVQYGLGSSRPSDDRPDPRWHPLENDNGASGHAFMAAIPWLNLARRSSRAASRQLTRGCSLVTGWSRLNDRAHYPSQILLGWVVAWNATGAVAREVESSREALAADAAPRLPQ